MSCTSWARREAGKEKVFQLGREGKWGESKEGREQRRYMIGSRSWWLERQERVLRGLLCHTEEVNFTPQPVGSF